MYNTGASSVEVCIYISEPEPPAPIPGNSDCPITFPFDLEFQMSPETAGK